MNDHQPHREMYVQRLRLELLQWELNCRIGRDKHFRAAARKGRLHTWLGLVATLLAALLASNAFATLTDHVVILRAGVALSVALATAALGFLKLDHQVGIHRTVGNTFAALSREARHCLHQTVDQAVDLSGIELQLKTLQRRYDETCTQADAAPTNQRDAHAAFNQNKGKCEELKARCDASDAELIQCADAVSVEAERHRANLKPV